MAIGIGLHCWFCEHGPCNGECQTGARFDEIPKQTDNLSLKYLLNGGWRLIKTNSNGSIILKKQSYRLYFNRKHKKYLKDNNVKKLEEIQIGLLKNNHFKILFRGCCKTIADFLRISNKYIK